MQTSTFDGKGREAGSPPPAPRRAPEAQDRKAQLLKTGGSGPSPKRARDGFAVAAH
jgi:hypothetical protein